MLLLMQYWRRNDIHDQGQHMDHRSFSRARRDVGNDLATRDSDGEGCGSHRRRIDHLHQDGNKIGSHRVRSQEHQ